MAVKAIIDADRLPSAVRYYQRFPREPSPAGNMEIGPGTIAAIKNLTMEKVLDEMAGLQFGDEVLLVCHGTHVSLLMPMAAGGEDAWYKGLDLLWHALRTLDHTNSGSSLSEWQKHVGRFSQAFKGGSVPMPTIADAKKHFEFLMNDFANRGKITRSTLDRLVVKLRKVRAVGLKRVEIRACNVALGDWNRARGELRTILRFFGCNKLVAPTTSTFYVPRFAIEAVDSQSTLDHWFGRFGTTHAPGTALEQVRQRQDFSVNPMDRHGRPRLINKLGSASARTFNRDFVLAIWELEKSSIYSAGAVTLRQPHDDTRATPDWSRVQAFVNRFIRPGHGRITGPFPIAGFWNTGGLSFALPNEPQYLKALVSVIR